MLNYLICGPVAANSFRALRTRTVLIVLILLLKHQDLFKFYSACNGQESRDCPLYSVVIFGRCLISVWYFFVWFGVFFDFFFLSFFPKVPFFLFIIFTVYTMLPFGMRGAVIISVLSALSHIIVISIVVSVTSRENKESILFQVRKYCLVK